MWSCQHLWLHPRGQGRVAESSSTWWGATGPPSGSDGAGATIPPELERDIPMEAWFGVGEDVRREHASGAAAGPADGNRGMGSLLGSSGLYQGPDGCDHRWLLRHPLDQGPISGEPLASILDQADHVGGRGQGAGSVGKTLRCGTEDGVRCRSWWSDWPKTHEWRARLMYPQPEHGRATA